MLDEQIDHIIRDAAERHNPAYNDKAWEKMAAKLDKNLPQKKDRKKFIFFLLFFFLTGGVVLFTVIQFTVNKSFLSKEITDTKSDEKLTTATTPPRASGLDESTAKAQNKEALKLKTGSTGNIMNTHLNRDDNDKNLSNISAKNKRSKPANGRRSDFSITAAGPAEEALNDGKEKIKNVIPAAGKTKGKTNIGIKIPELENVDDENIKLNPADDKSKINKTAEEEKTAVNKNKDVKEKEVAKTENKSSSLPDKKKTKKNLAGNFGLTFSVGPDLSFVKLNKLGKTTLTYGAGLSYSFGKRLTVGTGFYVTKKIYAATPDEYNTPGGITYPYFTGVDADCKVYEIPVSLSYNFLQRKNHNWFGGAGLSSFLMKSESYYYNYKGPTGQTYKYEKSVSNENKHYFAVLTLSGGYRYQLNKRVLIQAEPYIKLPLTGIGLGNVKLNSSGILFTVTVKPFAKAK